MKNLLRVTIVMFATATISYPCFAGATYQQLIPTNPIKNSQVRSANQWGDVYYDVSCAAHPVANGSASTFWATSVGTCANYTNGKETFNTPMTCYPEFRKPTLEEFNQLVGEPYCLLPHPDVVASQTRPADYGRIYYDVSCSNGSASTFWQNHAGTCYGYTNGIDTFDTPMTCYPEFRNPTLEEFNFLVGQPYCVRPNH